MKPWLKWSLAAALGLLALPIVTALVLVLVLDQADYKQQLSNAIESKTGRPLLIEGDLQVAFGVKPTIRAQSIRYPNAPWAKQPWAVEVDQADFTFDLWALLRGEVLVAEVVLRGPRLWVEKNAQGVYNLAPNRPSSQSQTQSQTQANPPRALPLPLLFPLWLGVSSVDIINGEIAVATPRRHWDIRFDRAHAESAGRDQPVVVDFRGAVEETPVIASATVGSLETLFAFQPSPIALDGWVGADSNRLTATGSVRNLLKWRGVDARLDYEVAQLAELSKLITLPLPNIAPFGGHARFHQPGNISTMQLHEITAHSTQLGLRGTLTGEVAKLYSLKGIDLNLSAAGVFDRALAEWADTFELNDLNADVSAALRGSRRDLSLIIDSARAENEQIAVDVRGEFNYAGGQWRGALPLSFTVKDFGALNLNPDLNLTPWARRALASIGNATATAELNLASAVWNLRDIRLPLEREALAVEVTGDIDDLDGAPAGRLRITGEAADGRHLQPLFDIPLPPLSDIELATEVAFAQSAFSATVERLKGRVFGVDLTANGTVETLNKLRGIDLAVTAGADDLRRLPGLAGRQFPRLGAMRMRGRLSDDEAGAFHLTDIVASNIDADADAESVPPMAMQARGEIRHLGWAMRADLDVGLNLASMDALQPWSPKTLFNSNANAESATELLKMAMPLTVAGKLVSTSAIDWQIRHLKAASQTASMDATLAGEITAFAPPQARLHLAIEDLATTGLPIPPSWKIPQLRDGELDLSLDVVAKAGRVTLENIAAAIDSPDATLALRGDIERLSPLQIDGMQLQFDAINVAALDLPITGPLALDNPVSGHLTVAVGAQTSGGRADIDVAIAASDLRGTVTWQLSDDAATPPRIDATLFSDHLDIREMLLKAPKKTRFFSPSPINTGWIHHINGNFKLSAGTANNSLLNMRDVETEMTLWEGTLTQTIDGSIGRGDVRAMLTIDANSRPFRTNFQMAGEHLDTEGLVAFHRDNYLDSGTFDVDIDVEAEGHSVASLAANAEGRAAFRMNKMKMKNQALDIFGGDIFSNLITSINPFRQIGEYVDIECGLVELDIERGVASARDNMVVKTDRVALLGGGSMDFNDESLNILILPKARKGFGINTSSLAKIVRIGGTLAEPKIEADGSRLPETLFAFASAFYSGGWSIVAQGLFDRGWANTDLCKLNGADKEPAQGRGAQTSSQSQHQPGSEK